MERLLAAFHGNSVQVPHDPEKEARRQASIQSLREMWHDSQRKLTPVIGSDLPIVYYNDDSSKSGILMVYMLDTSELGGHALDALRDIANEWVVSGGSDGGA